MTITPILKRRGRMAGVVLLFLISMLVAFRLGVASRYRYHIDIAGSELAATQATVWFNHLQTFRELESDLAAGCADVALEKTRIAIDDELIWLSWFRGEHAISSIYEYIEKRDAMLLGQLENFVSRYPESAPVPVCENRTAVGKVEGSGRAGQPAKPSGISGRYTDRQPGTGSASAASSPIESMP